MAADVVTGRQDRKTEHAPQKTAWQSSARGRTLQPSVSTPDPIVQQLQADVAQLQREMRVALAALRPRSAIVRRGDHAVLEALRQRIGHGVTFNAAEVLRHSELDPVLQAALMNAGLTTTARVGRRLASLGRRGHLERVERDEAGVVWMLPDAG